jgi:hypothetical protein
MNGRIRRVRSLEARAEDRQFEMVRRAFAGRSIEELEFFAEHGWWPAPEDLPASVTPIDKAMTREELGCHPVGDKGQKQRRAEFLRAHRPVAEPKGRLTQCQ